MTTVYDCLSPAHGVRVFPVPRARAVLNTSQAKAARTPDTNYRGQPLGVMKPLMKGGAVSLGVMKVARELQRASPIKATNSDIPGTRRRGHSHRPGNMCFSAPIPTPNQYQARIAAAKDLKSSLKVRASNIETQQNLLFMRRWHSRLLKVMGNVTPFYTRCRFHTLRLFPSIGPELKRVESAQRRSLLAG